MKFRAYDEKEKVMMYSDDTAKHDVGYFDGVKASRIHMINHCCLQFGSNLMVSTEWKDTEEEDVYEHDIICYNSIVLHVKYENGSFCGYDKHGDYYPLNQSYLRHFKVIGNMFEYPQLLQQGR